jgi:hypothetical protein
MWLIVSLTPDHKASTTIVTRGYESGYSLLMLWFQDISQILRVSPISLLQLYMSLLLPPINNSGSHDKCDKFQNVALL